MNAPFKTKMLTTSFLERAQKGLRRTYWGNYLEGSFVLATRILERVFGDEWVSQQFDSAPSYDNWLSRRKIVDQYTQDRFFLRTIDIAELILIGQRNDSVRRVIDDLSRLPIRPILTELRFAAHLITQKCEFEARRPCGFKTNDYDFSVRFESGEWGCAEAKFRHEFSNDIEKSISNTIRKARRQMPPDKPCAIFMEFDRPWIDQAGRDGMVRLFDTFQKAMVRSPKIVNITLTSQDWDIRSNRYQNEGRLTEIVATESTSVQNPKLFSKNYGEHRPTLSGLLFAEKGAFQTGVRPHPNYPDSR